MINSVYENPSLYAQGISGIIIFICLFILFNNYDEFSKVNPMLKINILLLFAIAIGIHSLGHFALEYFYGFNPIKMIK
jgi:hypothetical protein